MNLKRGQAPIALSNVEMRGLSSFEINESPRDYVSNIEPFPLPFPNVLWGYFCMLIRLPAGTEEVMKTLAPMTEPSPMIVSPPRIDAPA